MCCPYVQVFWNDKVWNDNASAEQSAKKQKCCNGLQSIIDLVEESEHSFSWSWFVLLGQLSFENPNTLDKTNYQVMLILLSRIQVSTHSGNNLYSQFSIYWYAMPYIDKFSMYWCPLLVTMVTTEHWKSYPYNFSHFLIFSRTIPLEQSLAISK